ncbi:MAG TPA: MarR family transcriptional regulator [Leptolyngbyaceae cyanobacterium]
MGKTLRRAQRLAPWQEVLAPYSLGYRIRLLSQLMARVAQDKLAPYGLTPFHWVVLCCLWEQDGLATSDIAEKLSQVGGTITGVIDRMEERGLVQRTRDIKDRRIWRIWLTDTGRELYDVLPDVVQEVREETLRGIPDEDLKRFSDLVDMSIANLTRSEVAAP